MPSRAPHPCAKPGCPNLTNERYCTEHAHLNGQADRERGSSSARGYNAAWQRIRLAALTRDPVCPLCRMENVIRPSSPVHHVNGNPKDNRRENLIAMCKEHHDAITQGNAKALDLLERALRQRSE